MPLGKICELVQQALMKKILEFHKGFVGVAEGSGIRSSSPPISENLNIIESPPLLKFTELDPTDDNAITIINLLPKALETLQCDMLKPYEQVVQARVRQLAENTKLSFKKKHWNSVLYWAMNQGYTIIDTPQGKVIYGLQGIFDGVDPRHPQSRFEGFVWDALQSFLVSVHPLRYPLRYQFATFLKNEGPAQLQVLPLGIISELVEAAISRGYLRRVDPKTIATTDFIPSYSNEGDLINMQPPHPLKLKSDSVKILHYICQRFLPSWPLPVSIVVDCSGPPHSPTFKVIIVLLNVTIGEGEGTSKKEGHSIAAYQALRDTSSLFYTLLRVYLSDSGRKELLSFLHSIEPELVIVSLKKKKKL